MRTSRIVWPGLPDTERMVYDPPSRSYLHCFLPSCFSAPSVVVLVLRVASQSCYSFARCPPRPRRRRASPNMRTSDAQGMCIPSSSQPPFCFVRGGIRQVLGGGRRLGQQVVVSRWWSAGGGGSDCVAGPPLAGTPQVLLKDDRASHRSKMRDLVLHISRHEFPLNLPSSLRPVVAAPGTTFRVSQQKLTCGSSFDAIGDEGAHTMHG